MLPDALAATAEATRDASRAIGSAWRTGPGIARLTAAFAAVDADDAEAVAVAAEALLSEDDWVAPLLAPLIAAQAADPWFEPPWRVSRDALRIGAILHDLPAGTLTAIVLDADALAAAPPTPSVVASGRLTVVRYVRGGGATLSIWPAGEAQLGEAARVALADGAVVRHDGRTHAHGLDDLRGDIVTLSFTVRAGAVWNVREYALAGGLLIRTASLDDAPSRSAMLLTMLRLSGRTDAGGVFLAATRHDAFFLRWEAMREWLALDALAALPRLAEMAQTDPHPEVRDAATRTLPLIHAHRSAACRA